MGSYELKRRVSKLKGRRCSWKKMSRGPPSNTQEAPRRRARSKPPARVARRRWKAGLRMARRMGLQVAAARTMVLVSERAKISTRRSAGMNGGCEPAVVVVVPWWQGSARRRFAEDMAEC